MPDDLEPRVFRTPHSTEWHRRIAEDNTVLLSEVGSTMHGVTIAAADDVDEMGVCIPPPEVTLGVRSSAANLFEQYEFRTQPVGARSGAGDIDRVIYSLQKFARLAGQGNPTVLMILFSPPAMLRTIDAVGEDLRSRRDMFVSKEAGRRFQGYLQRQRERFTGTLSPRTNRPELVAVHGYDTKYAYHSLRLAIQGTQLMTTGAIALPMIDDDRRHLLAVRRGSFTKDEVVDELDARTATLQAATAAADLPESADFDVISGWVADTYRAWWAR